MDKESHVTCFILLFPRQIRWGHDSVTVLAVLRYTVKYRRTIRSLFRMTNAWCRRPAVTPSVKPARVKNRWGKSDEDMTMLPSSQCLGIRLISISMKKRNSEVVKGSESTSEGRPIKRELIEANTCTLIRLSKETMILIDDRMPWYHFFSTGCPLLGATFLSILSVKRNNPLVQSDTLKNLQRINMKSYLRTNQQQL